MGLFVPRQYGGLQVDYQTFISVAEMLGQACPSTGMIFVMSRAGFSAVWLGCGAEDRRTA